MKPVLTAQPADPGDPFLLASPPSGRAPRLPGGGGRSSQTTHLKREGTRWMAAEAAERRQRVFTSRGISESLPFFSPASAYNEFVLSPLFGLCPPPRQGKTFKMGWGGRQRLFLCCVDLLGCLPLDRLQAPASDVSAPAISIYYYFCETCTAASSLLIVQFYFILFYYKI